ncbi:hypothetical protein E8E13_002786 [Curvularia kusanoi]|uniref:CENP-T/Histone H4 histone fold domain-containing protein n=1 Tax=Curvularia kusanoi TaxID=90978 RepID=A0A9P4TCI2_CURKU|nr:hypothetical protein E8E13_002786 [Curvularia kusanoi]
MAESARKKQRLTPEIAATPNATARTEPTTPFRRAISAGPTPTFRTPALARDSRPLEPEPQTLPRRSRHSALDLPDVVDSPDVAAPRLSMPLEDMYDDDSFHERPPRQSLLPDLLDDVDGHTVQSLEFGRRALSEDPRYSRRVSERFADLSELGAVNEEFEIDGTFINRRRTGAFDPLFDQTIVEEDEDTVEALTGRRDGPSSDADLGVFGQVDDTEEPTFRFHIPDRIRAPIGERTQEEELEDATAAFLNFPEDEDESEDEGENDEVNDDVEIEEDLPVLDEEEQEEGTALNLDEPTEPTRIIGWESDPGGEDKELAAYREEESALDRSLQAPEASESVQKRMGTRRKETKLSRIGLDYPSFPAAPVKKLALSFMKSQGSKAQLNKDALAALVQTTDDFFEQIGIDLAAYAQHAGRRMIEESDVLALMRRTRKISSNTSSFSLAQKMLPRELLQQLRMEPRPKLKGQKRKRLAAVLEEEE